MRDLALGRWNNFSSTSSKRSRSEFNDVKAVYIEILAGDSGANILKSGGGVDKYLAWCFPKIIDEYGR